MLLFSALIRTQPNTSTASFISTSTTVRRLYRHIKYNSSHITRSRGPTTIPPRPTHHSYSTTTPTATTSTVLITPKPLTTQSKIRAGAGNMAAEVNRMLSGLGLNDHITTTGFSDSSPEKNPVDIFRCYIADTLAKVSGVDSSLIYPALEWTTQFEKGDLVLAVPRLRLGNKRKPTELAEEWARNFPPNDYIKPPVPAGAFLQFFFSESLLPKLIIPQILKNPTTYGTSSSGKGKRVIVEFSSPNIAKPFHAGHLRSTIIGGFLSNLHEACGWEVVRMNYLGDWGKQFGVLAVGFERYGSEEELQKDPIHHLYDVYVRVNKDIKAEKEATAIPDGDGKEKEGTSKTDEEAREFFARLENGDEKALTLWARFRELSIEKYKETYARLNIKYDTYSGESQVSKESMSKAAKVLEEKGLSQKDEGAVIIDLTTHNKKLGKAIIQKKDGTTLYLTRDIGAAMERWDQYKFDKMIYVVACQQDLHLQQLFAILKIMGLEWADRCVHINFGMVLGMSTRAGTVVFLDDILKDTKDAMHAVMKSNPEKYKLVENPEEVAEIVGKSGVMIQDMSGKRINNYPFDMKRLTSFEGDTGPYLQYAHSRLCSITRKASIAEEKLITADHAKYLSDSTHAINLIRALAQYPDVILNTMRTQEPATMVTYLFKMTHLLSSSYDVLRVVGEQEELAAARLALYESARMVLRAGMQLLGLTPVERM